jgi:hypothetical protein
MTYMTLLVGSWPILVKSEMESHDFLQEGKGMKFTQTNDKMWVSKGRTPQSPNTSHILSLENLKHLGGYYLEV